MDMPHDAFRILGVVFPVVSVHFIKWQSRLGLKWRAVIGDGSCNEDVAF